MVLWSRRLVCTHMLRLRRPSPERTCCRPMTSWMTTTLPARTASAEPAAAAVGVWGSRSRFPPPPPPPGLDHHPCRLLRRLSGRWTSTREAAGRNSLRDDRRTSRSLGQSVCGGWTEQWKCWREVTFGVTWTTIVQTLTVAMFSLDLELRKA